MRQHLITGLVGLALVAGLSGCDHFPYFARQSRVRPIPATLPRESADGPIDRMYADAARAIERREYDTALEALQFAYSASPEDARVLNALGVVYDKLGRFDLSTHYYDLAEKADPGSKVVAANRRYSMLLQQGVSGPGVNPIMMAANAPPVQAVAPTPQTAPAMAPVAAPLTPVAMAVAAIGPARPAAGPALSEDELYRRAVACLERRAYGDALGSLRAARVIAPNDPRVLNALGVVYDWMGRFDLSAHYYDLADAAAPGSNIVALNRRYSRILQHHGGAVVGVQGVIQKISNPPSGGADAAQHVKRTALRAPAHRPAPGVRESHSG